jgi:hypothetical protein
MPQFSSGITIALYEGQLEEMNMALMVCSACGKSTLSAEGHCQFCGHLLKSRFSLWTRKLRRKEAYGSLLLFSGIFLFKSLEAPAILLLISGLTLIGYALFLPRVRRS